MYSICRLIPIRAVPWLPRFARFLLVPCVLSLLLTVTPAVAGDAAIVVRVLEGRVADRVTINAPSPVRVSFPGGALEQGPLTITVTVTADEPSALTLAVGDKTVRAASPLTIAPLSVSTILTVTTPTDEHRYRGTLTLSSEKGVIVLLNTVRLEEYLLSVVPAELSTRETAALKAQAIVCRTFALANRGRHTGWDLCDLTHCQHYAGVDTETAAGTRAVRETASLVVTYGGKPAGVFYHSSSGGMTTSPAYVWGGPAVPYLVPTRDALNGRDLQAASPDYTWTFTVEKRRLLAALTDALGRPVTGIGVAGRDPSGRAVKIRLTGAGTGLTGEKFRIVVCSRFGWGSLKSTLFELHETGGTYRFDGKGLGHGVGMSQWGAVELARMGRDYRQIIEFYFPGTGIEAIGQ
jgi:stage II sporulation protein D